MAHEYNVPIEEIEGRLTELRKKLRWKLREYLYVKN